MSAANFRLIGIDSSKFLLDESFHVHIGGIFSFNCKGVYYLSGLQRFKDWVNAEAKKELDKDGFMSLPLKVRIGIVTLVCTWLIGNGYPIMTMVISGLNHQLAVGAAKSTIVYVACWLLSAFGLSLAGKASIQYPLFFLAKFLKKLFPVYFKCE